MTASKPPRKRRPTRKPAATPTAPKVTPTAHEQAYRVRWGRWSESYLARIDAAVLATHQDVAASNSDDTAGHGS